MAVVRIMVKFLSPYLNRAANEKDKQYQTVYARSRFVAAPTALHFDQALIEHLKQQGVHCGLQLHVGAGTFMPDWSDWSAPHAQRGPLYDIWNLCTEIQKVKQDGVAVGNGVRALEAMAHSGPLRACCDSTALFIKPGFEFKLLMVWLQISICHVQYCCWCLHWWV